MQLLQKEIEARHNTSNYELERSLPKAKNKIHWINEGGIGRQINDKVRSIETRNI